MARYFLDCEFNQFGGDLISIALVSEHGHAISLVLDCPNPAPWVAENVIPILFKDPESRLVKREDIPLEFMAFFLGDPQPHIISDWPDDIKYFCECLITGPGQMVAIGNIVCQIVRVKTYPTNVVGAIQHNAYWDAQALKACFIS